MPQVYTSSSETSQINRGIIVRIIENAKDSFGYPIRIAVLNIASNLVQPSSIKICIKTDSQAPVDGPQSIATSLLSRITRAGIATNLKNEIKSIGYQIVSDPKEADLVVSVLHGKYGIGKGLINLVYSVANGSFEISKRWTNAYVGIMNGRIQAEPIIERDMPFHSMTNELITLHRHSENIEEIDSPSFFPGGRAIQNLSLYGLLAKAMKFVPSNELKLNRIVFNLFSF